MSDAPISRVYHDLDLYCDSSESKPLGRSLNNPIPASQRYVPSVAWIEFLLTVHPVLAKSNEFICYHNKFNWRPCVACRRSSQYARWWKDKYWSKVVALLSTIEPETTVGAKVVARDAK